MAKKLLIVEDDEHNVELISACFQDSGIDLSFAHDGREALATLAADNAFDLVLLDIMMPHVDGLEVLKHIRSDDKLANLKVVMVTARDQADDVVTAKKLGISGYIRKPFTPEQIINKVMSILG